MDLAERESVGACSTGAEQDPDRHADGPCEHGGHVGLDGGGESCGDRVASDADEDRGEAEYRDDHRRTACDEQPGPAGLPTDDQRNGAGSDEPALGRDHVRPWGGGGRPGDGEHLRDGGDCGQQRADDEEVQREPTITDPSGASDHCRRHERCRHDEAAAGLCVYLRHSASGAAFFRGNDVLVRGARCRCRSAHRDTLRSLCPSRP